MFYIIDNDGINVGCAGDFHLTWLEFSNLKEAQKIVAHWNKWCGI